MTGENLSLDRARFAVKQRYAQRFAIALPGRRVARFSQVDRRLDAVVILNVARVISLVE